MCLYTLSVLFGMVTSDLVLFTQWSLSRVNVRVFPPIVFFYPLICRYPPTARAFCISCFQNAWHSPPILPEDVFHPFFSRLIRPGPPGPFFSSQMPGLSSLCFSAIPHRQEEVLRFPAIFRVSVIPQAGSFPYFFPPFCFF